MERVKDIMSRDIVAALPSDSVEKIAKLMAQNDIGSVPIVEDGELKGVLTDRDIVTRCIADGKAPSSTKVSEVMTTDVSFVTPDQSVHDAVNMMATAQVRRLPVLSKGYVDGMVSLADIARRHAGPEIASAISEISEPNTIYCDSPNK